MWFRSHKSTPLFRCASTAVVLYLLCSHARYIHTHFLYTYPQRRLPVGQPGVRLRKGCTHMPFSFSNDPQRNIWIVHRCTTSMHIVPKSEVQWTCGLATGLLLVGCTWCTPAKRATLEIWVPGWTTSTVQNNCSVWSCTRHTGSTKRYSGVEVPKLVPYILCNTKHPGLVVTPGSSFGHSNADTTRQSSSQASANTTTINDKLTLDIDSHQIPVDDPHNQAKHERTFRLDDKDFRWQWGFFKTTGMASTMHPVDRSAFKSVQLQKL